MTTKKINKGFTLIEVLLVMVLIGVLLSIGLVSLNTEDRLIETRNNTRQTHIQTLESAITQYKLQEGNYPTGLNRNYQEICDPEATVCTGFFDIKPFLVPTYIQAIPQDPNDDNTTGGSGYSVAVDEITNTVSVRALQAEGGETISINDPLPAEPTVTANTQLAATVPNLPPSPVTATGGNITTINENGIWYKVHTFTTSGTFNVTNGGNTEYLVVGGGGSGGSRNSTAGGGGGGGAGGLLSGSTSVSAGSITVTVGGGGVKPGNDAVGNNGSNSVFGSVTAIGGGGGGRYILNGAKSGGSGGGAGRNAGTINGAAGTAGTPRQGYDGGGSANDRGAGGGGGAGQAGQTGLTAGSNGGKGGDGIASSISGASVTYAGGGGGGGFTSPAAGGAGGGGAGGYENGGAGCGNGTAGTANTGSGGGGGNEGAGGSGIVIVRYIIPTPTVTATGGNITTINENGIWYKVHTFLTNGTFTVTNGGGEVEYLVVGGGGGGGNGAYSGGGGGGAGGFRTGFTSVTLQSYSITVGGGGSINTNGGSSVFSTITSTGGGAGGGFNGASIIGLNGGSGGGGGAPAGTGISLGGTVTTPPTSPPQGNSGGAGEHISGIHAAFGGGGGASGIGGDFILTPGSGYRRSDGGFGGAGSSSSISGTSVTYAGGGGGGGYTNQGGIGGIGGVGGGGRGSGPGNAVAGTPNTGGGGGGQGHASGAPAAGGSGIVIVRYTTTAPPTPTVTATGGNITTINENGIWYKVHTFTTSGTFTVTNGGTVEYLVVAGGGGGGSVVGGGGGGGGVVSNTGTVAETTLAITIGQGGVPNTNGGNSAFGSITAYGGGGGGNWDVNGLNGGSGGGAGSHEYFTIMNPGTGIQGQGYSGGNSQICTSSGCPASAGGGGGAGSVGVNSPSLGTGGNGGNGIQWPAGSGIYYAGGGGGGCRNCYAGQSGSGIHGGGNGGVGYANRNGTAGTANTGGGGGGAGLQNTGNDGSGVAGNGGSGIVIVRYPTPTPTIVQNGLVLHLDAGNTSSYPGTGTTWTDLSGNSNNGTLINGVGYNSANGGSLVFDGANDGVQLPGTNLSLNQMTISSWNFSSNYTQNGFIFEKTTNGNVNSQYSLFYNGNNEIYYRTYGLSITDLTLNTTSAGVVNNQWNNVVATWDGTNKRIYVNSILRATSAALTGTVTQNTTGAAYIGIYGNFAGYPFNGRIAQTQTYNRALTAEEIDQNFNATKGRFGL